MCMKLALERISSNFLERELCKGDSFFTVCREIHSDTTSLSLE